MSTVVAIVKSIVGQVIATSAEGAHRVLVEGDRLYVGDTLDTGAGGMVTLELADGRMLDLGRDTQWSSADAASPITEATAQSAAEARAEVVDVQRAIVAGADPTQDLPATAAGPGAGGAAGGAAGGGRSFVLLSETAGEVQPEIGINFSNTTDGDGVVQQQAFGAEQNVAPRFVTADGNDASPTINVTTDEDVTFNGAFTAVDNNGDALTYTLVGTGPANGSLTLSPQGVWVYTPVANYNGPDSFQVVVTDGRGASDTLTVNIGVTPVNDAPVADAANGSATEDGAIVSGQLTASDVDTGDTQTFSLQAGATAPAGFTLNGNGTWSIDPSNAAYQNLAAGEQLTLNVPFTVTDSGGLTSNNVLTLTITGVNDAPVVSGDVTITTNEDAGGLTVDLLANASDVDKGDVVSVTNVAQSGAGDASGVTINANGTLSVTPGAYNYLAAGESVTLTYTYNVVDQNGGVTPASATITIDGVNDAPVVSAAVSAVTNEDAAPLTVNLLQNASDVDLSDSLSVANLQETSGGNTAGVSLNADGTLSVNPNAYTYLAAGQQVVLNYTYDVIDSNGGVTPTTATITIDGRNDAPVAVADVKPGSEDTVITGNVISNDSDVDAGAVLSVTKFSYSVGPFIFSANAGETLNTIVGKLTISANGDFTFTPVANYNGPVPTVTYTLSDGTATSTATLNINVTPVNDAPFITAPSSVQVTSEDTSKVFSVLRGNSIATGDIDSANLTTTLNVDHGTLTLGPLAGGVTVTGNGTGSLVLSGSSAAINAALQGLNYKPTADYNGVDNLKIRSTDGSLTTNSNVAIRVDAVADIRPDTVSVNEDNVLTFNAITGVGGGSADNFENAGRAVTSVTQGAHGSVTFNADGTLVYTPAANYNGTDTFTYTVTSGGVTETATVTVNVNPVNDAAVLTPANVAVAETDAAITTGGTLSISDIDSPATFAAQTNTAGTYGTFSVNANGAWTYQASSAYNNLNVGQSVSDTFTVVSADGTPTTVTVTINGTNDAPVASSSVVASGNEDSAAPIAVTLAGSDVDGTVTSYSIESLPDHGTLYSDAAGTQAINVGQVVSGPVYFVPTANWGGSTTFDFKAIDNNGASSTTGSAAINVTPVADAPTLTFGAGSQLASTDFQEINLSGGFSNSVSEGSLGGGQWHTGNGGNAVEVGSEGTYINGGSGSNQVIELERNPGDASNLYTTVAAQAGDTFVVQLQYSPRSGAEANSSIDVFWGGVKVGTLSGTTAGLTNYSFTLPADTAGNYTLEFRATDSNSVGGLLDNISLGQQVNVGLEDHAIRLSSITAAVTDTDGSESISKITIDDAPAGSVLSDGNGNTVTSTGSPVDITGWAKGSLTLTPPANFNGTIVLHVSATSTEATGGSATTTLPLTVTVRPENDAPTATNQSLTTEEDTPLTGTVTGSDVDGDTLTYSLVTAPAHGTLTLNTNGSFTYTPAKDYTGPDSFQALVSDGKGGTTTSTINIGVTPDNDAPTVGNQTLTTAEETPLTGAVTGSDADGDSLSYNLKTPAANGNVALNADGTFTYTPNSNYNGSDTFTVTVADGKGGTVDSVISIGVTPVNDAPTTANQTLTTAEDTPLTGAVTGNDVDGDTLSYNVKTPAANGNVALNADGTFTYTPNSNYNGGDSFTVTVADGKGGTVDSVISIGVTPVNDAPTSANQSLTTSEDTPLTGAVTGTDVDGDTLSYNVKTPAANGNVALNADGTFTYTPNSNYNGSDTFTVTVADGKGGTVDSVISIGVTPVNDAPTTANQTLTTAEDTPLTGTVTGTDVDGDSLSYTVKTPAANGNVALNADGTFTYTPNSNYNGGDSFTVTVSDGKGGTVDSVITVGVTPVNDKPITENQALTTAEDTPLSGAVMGSDADGDTLTYTLKTGPANGTVLVDTDGKFTYSPASNYNGADTFTVTISDGKGGTVDSVINIGVTPVNDAPVVTSSPAAATGTAVEAGNTDAGATVAGTPTVSGTLTASDVDQGSVTTWTVANGTGNYGTLAITAAGVWTYTLDNANAATQALAEGQTGKETFTATVSDGQGGTATQVITVDVTGTNDSPVVAAALSAAGAEDGAAIVVNLLSGASDVDAGALLKVSGVSTLPAGVSLSGSTLTVNPSNASFQSLAQGETKVITVTYNVEDDKGAVTPQTATITVTGTNDAPTVSGAVTATGAEDSASFNVNLLTNASDVDNGAVLSVTDVGTLPAGVTRSGTTLTVNPSDSSFQSLAVGESKVLTINYSVTDQFGAKTAQTAVITITGTNDAPVVTSSAAAATGTVVEAGNTDPGAVVAGTPSATGTLTASDVDHNSSTTWSLPNGGAGSFGTLALTAAGVWTYTLDNAKASTQALAEGQVGKETFTALVSDGQGGTATQVITVNVTGTNDSPVVSGAVTGSGVEDGASFTVNLLAGASDVDSGSSLSVANVGTLPAGVSRVGSVLTVDPSNAAFQALKAGEQQTLTVTYNVVDDKGAVVAQTAVITITGTNDAPVITSNAAAAAGTVTEAGLTPAGAATVGTATASGTLTATDVDHDSSTSWSLASGTGTGTYGSLTLSAAGAWTYTLDNSKPATQALAVGESRTETFSATVSDGQGGSKVQVITVTVNGTNDAPVVTSAASAATGTVVEAGLTPAGAATAGTPSATGTLTASDADHGSSTTWSVANGTGTYGSLTMSSAGVWTYTLDNSKPATQALGAGSTGTETFTATVSDGLGGTTTQVINVNVTGTNDAPVAVADTYVLGLTGQYYGYAQGNGANLATISQVESLIAGKTPDATFVSTNLNYGGVSTNLGEGTNLQTFLGNDKASLSTDPGNTSDAIIKLSGQISLAAGNYTFKVTSDDGFILRIDGQDVVKFDGNRSAASTTANFTIPTGGAHQIEIVYWDQGGNAALKVEVKAAGAADSAYTVLGASGNTGSLVTAEDTALTINASTLLKNDSDVDGNTLTLTSVQNPTHGIVALNNGVITFTPDANYNGEATFQYSVSDGKGGTASATVTMYVTPVNDAPVVAVTPVALSGDEDTSITITSAQLLGNATDPDGNALTVVGLSKTSGEGTLVANADGTWTFTPTKDWNGEVKFSYTVSDGTVATADSAVLTVKPVADIKADTGVTDEDTAVTLNVLFNDGFSNTATISAINGTSIASNGSVAVDHGSVKLVNGKLEFTPTADYHGQSNFTYTVTSGGVTETSTVSLMINSVSDAAIPTVSVTPKGYWTFDSTTSNGSVVTNEITKQTGTLADADSNKTGDLPQLSSTSRAEGAGKNLVFNSGSDTGDHIDVSTSVTAALMGTATLTFWINTAQAGNANGAGSAWSNPSIIGSEQVSGGNDIQWGAINAAGKIGFGLGNVDGVYSTTSVNDSQWHNVAISRDSSTGLVNVYVDGKLEATGSPVDAAFTGALNQLLEIGATNAFTGNGKDANDTSYFKGALDDLRIYSGVLSADQVAAIHHVENGYQGTAIANATTVNESTLSLSVTDNASVLKVSGLEAGMIISDGNGHTATSTGVDSLIDLSNWTTSNLTLSHTGTDSGTLIFTGTNTAANGDVSTTYQALTLANGTSVLATGTAGVDTLTGSTAADLLRGGDGNDTLHGLAGNDRLEGGNGNDSLFGGAGNDLLIGGAGDDILYGGSGNNILTGGANADTFTWQAGDVGKSTITDFNATDGDRINLSDLLPDITDTNVLSYLKVDTATSTIQVSTSGHIDQGSDVSITLQGVDLNNYGSSSADIIKSLVAGTDPVVKTDHH